MQKIFRDSFLIISIIYNIFIINNNVLAKDKYPRTIEEQEIEDMGSIVGGEGLIFRPSKVRNESTKTQASIVNKYLWQASIETLRFTLLASVDANGGVIITDWYSPKEQPNFRFKINIFIKDNVISPDAIEVRIFEQIFKNARWIENDNKSNFTLILEEKILRRARELYINTERKK